MSSSNQDRTLWFCFQFYLNIITYFSRTFFNFIFIYLLFWSPPPKKEKKKLFKLQNHIILHDYFEVYRESTQKLANHCTTLMLLTENIHLILSNISINNEYQNKSHIFSYLSTSPYTFFFSFCWRQVNSLAVFYSTYMSAVFSIKHMCFHN